ncbi:MAG: hypothetical protein A4E57_01317 [Syntrophorhabdaceae bacterium PtaU1.Bin034]|jgi:lysophospholipid acyltransferase (LPLAT)-like uncharacterized protein|nr:MAG: hypothetical protein A4E57_01317 [Syntrophorhabdaceae bacterium PtaU1.Bin034]
MLKNVKYFIMLNFLPPVVYLVLTLLKATLRIEHINKDPVERLWQQGDNIIACFWHGRLLAMPFAYKGTGAKVLISRHRDGEFIARVIKYFGLGTVRGSHRKSSVSSVREMLAELKQGTSIAITPDGPKGPRYQVKQGIIELARISQIPIVPVTCSASKKKVFNSWDRFLLPYPFSTMLFLWGNPIYVPKNIRSSEIEAKRQDLEKTLVSLTETADRMACGN